MHVSHEAIYQYLYDHRTKDRKELDQRQVLFPSDDNYFSRSWSS